MLKKILLLGSGELGKEFVIAAQRLGQNVVAVDSYSGAPAMQVADASEVINMLDGDALDAVVARHQPDLIVPEIEAIRTERFYAYEKQGIQVVPSAKAANFTMDRMGNPRSGGKGPGDQNCQIFVCRLVGGDVCCGGRGGNALRGETTDVVVGKRAVGNQM